MLAREGRDGLAQACFDFLPTRARLDLMGWSGTRHFRATATPAQGTPDRAER